MMLKMAWIGKELTVHTRPFQPSYTEAMASTLAFSSQLALTAGVLDKYIHNWDVIEDILGKWISGKLILNKDLKLNQENGRGRKWKRST